MSAQVIESNCFYILRAIKKTMDVKIIDTIDVGNFALSFWVSVIIMIRTAYIVTPMDE